MIHFHKISSGINILINFKNVRLDDALTVADIAAPIWREYYTPIIGKSQVEYMLTNLQSESAIKHQLQQGVEYLIVEHANNSIGYIATQPKRTHLFLSKFYLSSAYRGKGIARQMLDHVIDIAHEKKCNAIELTINKYNPTLAIYQKLGFENVESITIDIGGGYIMDDYRMLKTLD